MDTFFRHGSRCILPRRLQPPKPPMPEIQPVRSRTDREAFLLCPRRIYRDLPAWVPPIRSMQRRDLDPERGAFFHDGFGSKAAYFLAREGREVLGRIAAIRNERHLAQHGDGIGFFGFFDSVEDRGVAGGLLGAAEGWLREEGLVAARGPTSFTLNDPTGVTIEGHGLRPSVQIGYTPAYYAGLLEDAGYRKVRDLLCFQAPIERLESDLLRQALGTPGAGDGALEIRPVRRKELASESALFARIFSRSWERNWGAFPMLPEDLVRAAKELGPFFDERLGAVVTLKGEPVGVCLAVVDPWEIFHRCDGKIGVGGLLRILRERHRIERLRIFLLGFLPEHRGLAIGPLMLDYLRRQRPHFPALKTIEFSWILEDNRPMRSLAEAFGAELSQRLRVYEKFLGD